MKYRIKQVQYNNETKFIVQERGMFWIWLNVIYNYAFLSHDKAKKFMNKCIANDNNCEILNVEYHYNKD